MFSPLLDRALRERRLIKVDAGIDNHRVSSVLAIVAAAGAAGAQIIDLPADHLLLNEIRHSTRLPIFASSREPAKLIGARGTGVDGLELEGEDSLTDPAKLLAGTRAIRGAIGGLLLSVRLPGSLSPAERFDLAVTLQAAGADLLVGTMESEHAIELAQALSIPLILSGTPAHPTSCPFGASGIELGGLEADALTLEEIEGVVRAARRELEGEWRVQFASAGVCRGQEALGDVPQAQA